MVRINSPLFTLITLINYTIWKKKDNCYQRRRMQWQWGKRWRLVSLLTTQKQLTFHFFTLLTSGLIHNIWQIRSSSLLRHRRACSSKQSVEREFYCPATGSLRFCAVSRPHILPVHLECKANHLLRRINSSYFLCCYFIPFLTQVFTSGKINSIPEWTKK